MGYISFAFTTSFHVLLLLVLVQSGYGALRKVSPGELQAALDTASPGDTIQLAPAVFMGEFIASKDGTESSPIIVTGDRNSTIISEGNTAFTIKGNYWKLKSFMIMQPSVGVLVEGNGNSLESLVFQTLGKGIQVKGQGNTIKSCVISDAEGGIYVEADRNNLYYNSINIEAPSIIVEEGTCCGLLMGNVANGVVSLKGSSYNVTGNVCNHGLYVTGCENSFSKNVANGASFPKDCQSHDLGGNSYRGLGPNDTELPVPPGQQQQQQQQYDNYSSGSVNNQQGGRPQSSSPVSSHSQRQNFPAQVTGGGGSSGRAPQCTCTCV